MIPGFKLVSPKDATHYTCLHHKQDPVLIRSEEGKKFLKEHLISIEDIQDKPLEHFNVWLAKETLLPNESKGMAEIPQGFIITSQFQATHYSCRFCGNKPILIKPGTKHKLKLVHKRKKSLDQKVICLPLWLKLKNPILCKVCKTCKKMNLHNFTECVKCGNDRFWSLQ